VQTNREVAGLRHPLTLGSQLGLATLLVKTDQRAEAIQILQQMEPNLLGWIGQELHSTEAGAVRRRLVSSQATIQALYQDMILSLATAAKGSDARRLAATVMLRFKVLQGEEEAYLARLARRSQNPRVQTLAADVSRLRAALAAATQGAPDAFEKTLVALEGKRRELIDASPEYKDRLQVLDASPDDVRKALPAGAVLIEFRQFRPFGFDAGKSGAPRFAGMLMTGAAEPLVTDLGLVSDLRPLAAALAGGPGGRGLAADPQGKPLTPADEAATKLYERLFAPFKDAVDPATTVYIAPDGILNLVPFARLKLPDGHYWSERQQVRLLQTGRDLLRPGADHPTRGLLALGGIDFGATPAGSGQRDSAFLAAAGVDRTTAVTRAAEAFLSGFPALPATAAEVTEVTERYRQIRTDESAEIWSGAEASKARLMALKTAPRVLHLATHGFYLPNQSREPMLLSGIVARGRQPRGGQRRQGGFQWRGPAVRPRSRGPEP
jgi:hypothetical protein